MKTNILKTKLTFLKTGKDQKRVLKSKKTVEKQVWCTVSIVNVYFHYHDFFLLFGDKRAQKEKLNCFC